MVKAVPLAGDVDTRSKYFTSPARWSIAGRYPPTSGMAGPFTLITPAAADVQVRILNKHHSHDRAGQDRARFYIELTK